MRHRFLVTATLEIQVELDDKVIVRCVENHDDSGSPQPDERGGTGWRNTFYDLDTPEGVAKHLAYNLGIGHAGLSGLDGWADLDDGLAFAHVIDADYMARPA